MFRARRVRARGGPKHVPRAQAKASGLASGHRASPAKGVSSVENEGSVGLLSPHGHAHPIDILIAIIVTIILASAVFV